MSGATLFLPNAARSGTVVPGGLHTDERRRRRCGGAAVFLCAWRNIAIRRSSPRALCLIVCAAVISTADAATERRLVIHDARPLLTAGDDTLVAGEPVTVIIEQGVITSLVDPDAYVFAEGDELYRATGRWIMPGLIDVGVAAATPLELRLMPLFGVTTAAIHDGAQVNCLRGAFSADSLAASTVLVDPAALAKAGWKTPLLHPAPAPAGPDVSGTRPDHDHARSLPLLADPSRTAIGSVPSAQRQGTPGETHPDSASAAVIDDVASPVDSTRQVEPPLDRVLVGSGLGARVVSAGRGVIDEMNALLAAGVPAVDVLAGATSRGAHALGMRDEVGRIAAGARADLLVLDANPLEDPAALERLHAVVLNGRMLYRVEIEVMRERFLEALQLFAHPRTPLPTQPAWAAGCPLTLYLWTLDGLPIGVHTVQERIDAEGGVRSLVQREYWTPLWSRTTIVAEHDGTGRLVRANLDHDAPVSPFEAGVVRSGNDLDLELRVEGRPEPLRHRIAEGADHLLLLDLLPMPSDLGRLLQDAVNGVGMPRVASELVYGEGTIELASDEFTCVAEVIALEACVEASARGAVMRRRDGTRWEMVFDDDGRVNMSRVLTPAGVLEMRRVPVPAARRFPERGQERGDRTRTPGPGDVRGD